MFYDASVTEEQCSKYVYNIVSTTLIQSNVPIVHLSVDDNYSVIDCDGTLLGCRINQVVSAISKYDFIVSILFCS